MSLIRRDIIEEQFRALLPHFDEVEHSDDRVKDFMVKYDEYIINANEEDLYSTGWRPVSMEEFYYNEYVELCLDELDRAITLISEYLNREYGEPLDQLEKDIVSGKHCLEHIPLMYTEHVLDIPELKDKEVTIFVSLNLMDFWITGWVDECDIYGSSHSTFKSLIEDDLEHLDFDELLHSVIKDFKERDDLIDMIARMDSIKASRKRVKPCIAE